MVQPGDVVIFPQAPWKQNQERRYLVTEADDAGITVKTEIEGGYGYDIDHETAGRFGMVVVAVAEGDGI